MELPVSWVTPTLNLKQEPLTFAISVLHASGAADISDGPVKLDEDYDSNVVPTYLDAVYVGCHPP